MIDPNNKWHVIEPYTQEELESFLAFFKDMVENPEGEPRDWMELAKRQIVDLERLAGHVD